jgi:hypothetical protein
MRTKYRAFWKDGLFLKFKQIGGTCKTSGFAVPVDREQLVVIWARPCEASACTNNKQLLTNNCR